MTEWWNGGDMEDWNDEPSLSTHQTRSGNMMIFDEESTLMTFVP